MSEAGIGRVAFLGGGFMGEGIVQGLISQGVSNACDLCVCDVSEGRRIHLGERYGVGTTSQLGEAVRGAAIVVLSVKPQDFDELTHRLVHELKASQIVLSIMAGVRLATIGEKLQHERIVRAMPNTPGAIGEGYTAWTATPAIVEAEIETVTTLLGALGGTAYFPDEKYLDMATAVSGSGPGFVMLFVEAMIDAAVLIGLKRDVATDMVLRTFSGSARYAHSSGLHPAELRNAVTSPGGTTAVGLLELERAGVRAAVMECVRAAFEQSRALGG